MTADQHVQSQLDGFDGEWNPTLIRRMLSLGGPFYKLWYRPEARDMDRLPPAGC